ncbi:MAG: hypothetical protein RIT35_163 [Pseudomonadota bacterium]|jgi:two-component system response regulator RegA
MTNKLLLVDDDPIFCRVLAQALTKREYKVDIASNIEEALTQINMNIYNFAILDLKMPSGSGLSLIAPLKSKNELIKTIMLTGYASIATAIAAIKLGATYYLAKPVDADDIISAFFKGTADGHIDVNENHMSVKRHEWEYINRILNECEGNISQAAKVIGMHRRTLQRKLAKKPVKL